MLFKNEFDFLSNMYPLEGGIVINNNTFSCTESFYQASKAVSVEDYKKFIPLNGYEAKKLGKQIVIRKDWESIKLQIMEFAIAHKFKDGVLLAKLIQTPDYLEETNYWNDTFWGVCKGVGENHLGKILMSHRNKYKINTSFLEVPSFNIFYNKIKYDLEKVFGYRSVWYANTPYEYSGIKHTPKLIPNWVNDLKHKVENSLGYDRDYFNACLINYFPKGKGIGYHNDAEPINCLGGVKYTPIAVLTIGGENTIRIKENKSRETCMSVTTKHGHIYSMPEGEFQTKFLHGVSPSKEDRISITFRRVKSVDIIQKDLYVEEEMSKYDLIGFTANNIVKKDGTLVMGAGNAKVVRDKFPGIDMEFGRVIPPNKDFYTMIRGNIIAVQTKRNWRDKTPKELLINSLIQLNRIIEKNEFNLKIALPVPGISNGGLSFEEVVPLLIKYCPLVTYYILPTKKRYYTGVGSRETPGPILKLMEELSISLEESGFTLRSGGANGADDYFERNVLDKDIFLPWYTFNNRDSEYTEAKEETCKMAEEVIPHWGNLKRPAKKLHARNVHQTLGWDLKTPSEFLICWTKNGKLIGGTATAIKLAIKNNVKVFNLANSDDRIIITLFLKYVKNITLANKWGDAYYIKDEPIATDQEYDLLNREIIKFENSFPIFISDESPSFRIGGIKQKMQRF